MEEADSQPLDCCHKEGLDASISVQRHTSMDTQVFISSCVQIYCVLSAAHFNGDQPCCIIKLDTTTLAHGDGLTGC